MSMTCGVSEAQARDARRIKWLEECFDFQLEALIKSRIYQCISFGEDTFRRFVCKLKCLLPDIQAEQGEYAIPFLIVIPSSMVDIATQCNRISWDGRNVKMSLLLGDLVHVANGRPSQEPYLATRIDPGNDYSSSQPWNTPGSSPGRIRVHSSRKKAWPCCVASRSSCWTGSSCAPTLAMAPGAKV